MNRLTQALFIVLLSGLTAFAVTRLTAPDSSSAISIVPAESAFERVVKTNTLRCGYAVATPWFMIDPNTKKFSGVGYDVTNAVAEKMHVKVEWVEETGWGVAEQGLHNNRYDMLCGSVCVDPNRSRAATFSMPFVHIPVLAVVRADDDKFKEVLLDDLNSKDIRIGVKNGHVFEYTANERFPQAQKIYANDLSDDTEFLLMLTAHKIDVAFAGQETVDLYNKQYSGSIRSIPEPARYCNGAFMLPLGDMRLKLMVDNAIAEINSSGRIKTIMGQYMSLDPRYVRVPAQQYQEFPAAQ